MRGEIDLRWQVRLPSRAALNEVKELTGVIAALSGETRGQVIFEALKAYAIARLGADVIKVLSEITANQGASEDKQCE